MNRHHLTGRVFALVTLALVGMGLLAQGARAAAAPDVVWVVDDETTQARCTSQGTPCLVGSSVIMWVHKVSVAAAESAHQTYISSMGTTRADLMKLITIRSQEIHEQQLHSAHRLGCSGCRNAATIPSVTVASGARRLSASSCSQQSFYDAGSYYLPQVNQTVYISSFR